MNNKLRVGDIVCLNHSDVLLTVLEDESVLNKPGYCKVCWFNEAGDFCSVEVPVNVLRKESKEPQISELKAV